MKNYTLKSLYLSLLVVLLGASPNNADAQGVGCTVATTFASSLTPNTGWQTATVQSNKYYTFTASAGCTYTFSFCNGGGNFTGDPALTITDAANNFIVYNDDGLACGNSNASEIIWTAPAAGTYRLHYEKCCCTPTGTVQFSTLAYKVACPCVAGTAFASPNPICFGGTTTLTLSGYSPGANLQWQSSPNNTVWTNINGGNVTPYTTGSLSATTYFRAITTCNGVGNTVGMDTTVSIVDSVYPVTPILFPPLGTVCVNADSVLLNSATPPGGTYTTTTSSIVNVGGQQFVPLLAGVGTHVITYNYTDLHGCLNTATQPITVIDTPTVTFPPLNPVCYSTSSIIPLNTATPAGGTYGGGAYVVANNFFPNISNCGNFPVTYSYTSGGCSSTKTQIQTVHCLPVINMTAMGPYCTNDGNCYTLTATPAGGTFSGSGVNTSGQFCPLGLSGNQNITYSYTDPVTGCSNSQTMAINVEQPPVVSWTNTIGAQCVNNCNNINLNAYVSVTGGTFSGNGVSGTSFNPCNAGIGTHTITYQLFGTGSCVTTITTTVTVNPTPTVTFDITDPWDSVCVNTAAYSLLPFASPATSTFSGPGVTGGNTFNPTTAGPGLHTITYVYTDPVTGCQSTLFDNIWVQAVPNVNLPPYNTPICFNAPDLLLNTATPPGGVYTSDGFNIYFSGGNYYLDPNLVPADTFLITYTYTGAFGCTAFDTSSIIVRPAPTVTFAPLAAVCDNAADVLLIANPPGGTFIGLGTAAPYVSGGYFLTGAAPVGTYTIRYVYSDISGCSDSATQTIIVKPVPTISSVTNIVNPLTCGSSTGSFRINGLTPNTGYVLTYERNGVPQGPFNIVSNGAGQYTRTNLLAGTYGNIIVELNGCQSAPFNSAILQDPNAPAAPTAGSNSPLCQFSTLQLTASSGVTNGSYQWTGPSSFSSNQQNPAITNVGLNAAGNYLVTVTDNLNCTSLPTTVTVVINPAPNLTVGSNSPVCAGDPINLTASSTTTGTSFAWSGPSSFSANVANPTIAVATPANAGWYYAVATGPNGCTRRDSLLMVIGTVTPATPTAGSNSPVCSGTTLALTATASNPGSIYSWSGPNTYNVIAQNPTRPNIQLADSGIYSVVAVLNGCPSDTDTVHVTVIQSLTPTITIAANPDDTVCYGTNIVFTSTIADGGISPQYQWYKNGVPVIGAIDSFWGSPYLTDLDTVYAVLINATTCTTASSDTSNKLTVHMAPNTIPTVQIVSNPMVYVAGQNMTFTASVANAGTSPAFQWYLNGAILIGETNNTYSSSTLLETDLLTVLVTSNAPCAIPDTASDDWSGLMSLSVSTAVNGKEEFTLFPNPNNGSFKLTGTFKDMKGTKDATLEVVNAVGQVVLKDKATIQNGQLESYIRLYDAAAGAYILRINAGGQTAQVKFIISK